MDYFMPTKIFQPFTDRLSRDIRNDLSESLVKVIEAGTMLPAERAASRYISKKLDSCYIDYIDDRLRKYSLIYRQLSQHNIPLLQGLILWDKQLFFEVHEILEHAWMKAVDEERLFLQAMIRAAGVYIKLEAGYPEPAARIARKAIPVLVRNRSRLSPYTDPNLLISALSDLSQPPPQLLS